MVFLISSVCFTSSCEICRLSVNVLATIVNSVITTANTTPKPKKPIRYNSIHPTPSAKLGFAKVLIATSFGLGALFNLNMQETDIYMSFDQH